MDLRPLPDDPSAELVVSMFDLSSDEWMVIAAGDYQTACVEAMNRQGGAHQVLVALELPCRVNNSDELRTVRLLVSPEDAGGIGACLIQSAQWLAARTRLGN